jgi:excisionase family DNA binding protein
MWSYLRRFSGDWLVSPMHDDTHLDAVLTVAETAKTLRCSLGLAYEAVRSGQIPSIRIGRRILVPRAALELMLAQSGSDLAVTGPLPEPEIPVTKKGVGCAPD